MGEKNPRISLRINQTDETEELEVQEGGIRMVEVSYQR